jgi:hypothetical protein
MTAVLLRPVTQPAIAWQFNGQPLHQWPSWVQDCCTMRKAADGALELLHARRSGGQAVYLGEWLVRDLDGEACCYTDGEVRKRFEQRIVG